MTVGVQCSLLPQPIGIDKFRIVIIHLCLIQFKTIRLFLCLIYFQHHYYYCYIELFCGGA